MTGRDRAKFERLLDEAAARPMVGWDFSWLGERMTTSQPDPHYDEWVSQAIHDVPDLLDMGTGGGEWLANLSHRPPRTVATEGWAPNVQVARDRLSPFGIEVHPVGGGPDNAGQQIGAGIPAPGSDGALPFLDASFHLIVNRHESFVAAEVRRLLVPGGLFITRQIGDGTGTAIRSELGLPVVRPLHVPWTRELATDQLRAAAFHIEDATDAVQSTLFDDAAAFGWYVASVPWYVDGFAIDRSRDALRALQERIDGGHRIRIPEPVFTIRARAI